MGGLGVSGPPTKGRITMRIDEKIGAFILIASGTAMVLGLLALVIVAIAYAVSVVSSL